jgi:hypothetical protein
VNPSIVKDALGGIERDMGQVREIMYQIDADVRGVGHDGVGHDGGWRDTKQALRYFLEHLYETLLLLLEASGLPETRSRLVGRWREFEKARGGVGATTYDPEFDLQSKPFSYLENLVDGLRSLVRQGGSPVEAFELARLESILRKTSVLVRNRGLTPTGEIDVQRLMHEHLAAFFTDYTHPLHISGVIRNFEPDGGIRHLAAAIEFKFADTKAEVGRALSGIFEDISAYKGSSEWSHFYTVVYQTESFESEDRFKSEMTRVGALDWTPVLVTGSGSRGRRSRRVANRVATQRTK